MNMPQGLTQDDFGVVVVSNQPTAGSHLDVALFSVKLLPTLEVFSAMSYLGVESNGQGQQRYRQDLVPTYIFGLAFAGGLDYLEVSAFEFSPGTYINGVERGPHYEEPSEDVPGSNKKDLMLREAKGALKGIPFTLLPPAEPSFGEEYDEDFEEDEARPRDVTISLDPDNYQRVMYLQSSWRQAIEFCPEYEADAKRPTFRERHIRLEDHLEPLQKTKDNRFWSRNWALENFELLNRHWEAFRYLTPSKTPSKKMPF
jgi:hypothetical protein